MISFSSWKHRFLKVFLPAGRSDVKDSCRFWKQIPEADISSFSPHFRNIADITGSAVKKSCGYAVATFKIGILHLKRSPYEGPDWNILKMSSFN